MKTGKQGRQFPPMKCLTRFNLRLWRFCARFLVLPVLLVTPLRSASAEDKDAPPAAATAEDFRRAGLAAEQRGDYALAVAELERAVARGRHYHYRGMTLARIGDLYRDHLAAPDKALAVYRAVSVEQCKLEHHAEAATGAAGILLARNDAEAALRELDAVDPREAARSSRGAPYLVLRGNALAAAGRPQEAFEAWRAALRHERLDPTAKPGIEQAISRLLHGSGKLVLAADGRCEYQILLPADASDPRVDRLLRAGAELLQKAFAANGFAVAVTNESSRDPGRPGIFLGNTRFARSQGVDASTLAGWSYVHKVACDRQTGAVAVADLARAPVADMGEIFHRARGGNPRLKFWGKSTETQTCSPGHSGACPCTCRPSEFTVPTGTTRRSLRRTRKNKWRGTATLPPPFAQPCRTPVADRLPIDGNPSVTGWYPVPTRRRIDNVWRQRHHRKEPTKFRQEPEIHRHPAAGGV